MVRHYTPEERTARQTRAKQEEHVIKVSYFALHVAGVIALFILPSPLKLALISGRLSPLISLIFVMALTWMLYILARRGPGRLNYNTVQWIVPHGSFEGDLDGVEELMAQREAEAPRTLTEAQWIFDKAVKNAKEARKKSEAEARMRWATRIGATPEQRRQVMGEQAADQPTSNNDDEDSTTTTTTATTTSDADGSTSANASSSQPIGQAAPPYSSSRGWGITQPPQYLPLTLAQRVAIRKAYPPKRGFYVLHLLTAEDEGMGRKYPSYGQRAPPPPNPESSSNNNRNNSNDDDDDEDEDEDDGDEERALLVASASKAGSSSFIESSLGSGPRRRGRSGEPSSTPRSRRLGRGPARPKSKVSDGGDSVEDDRGDHEPAEDEDFPIDGVEIAVDRATEWERSSLGQAAAAGSSIHAGFGKGGDVLAESSGDDEDVMEQIEAALPMDRIELDPYYCRYCESVRAVRSRHCHSCGVCVPRYDHHCVWLGTCVGEKNHGYFVTFLYWQTVLIIMAFAEFSQSFWPWGDTWQEWLWNVPSLGITISLAFMGFMPGALFFLHLYLCCVNMTSWETLGGRSMDPNKPRGAGFLPFDHGLIENILMLVKPIVAFGPNEFWAWKRRAEPSDTLVAKCFNCCCQGM